MRRPLEHRRLSHPRAGLPAGVWSLAALSIAACLCSVLGAKLLSNMFEPPEALAPAGFSRGAETDLPGLAKAAPQTEAPAPTGQREVDVDRSPTGTIPDRRKGRKALTPCGEAGEIADH
ncbi:hypothetical protein [Methylocystis sp. SB2]|uniref:hypothetical protein n=1 Tax=Methylocystis sp. (strain SB2) TaxID=743836 RepID=UPI0004A2FCC5|nr:hypothetical protein [Methylocystis sp. SB2]PWB91662.1 hypothetical protein C5688_03875 [Methylocystis sp. MitZ-2018]ULO24620.1 hypothetical protein LNB28_04250 [Methylocystis sp. SB2]